MIGVVVPEGVLALLSADMGLVKPEGDLVLLNDPFRGFLDDRPLLFEDDVDRRGILLGVPSSVLSSDKFDPCRLGGLLPWRLAGRLFPRLPGKLPPLNVGVAAFLIGVLA